MQPGEKRPTTKPCVICGKPSIPSEHPFCSRRCADIDLHRWMAGRYAVPVTEPDEDMIDTDGRDEDA